MGVDWLSTCLELNIRFLIRIGSEPPAAMICWWGFLDEVIKALSTAAVQPFAQTERSTDFAGAVVVVRQQYLQVIY